MEDESEEEEEEEEEERGAERADVISVVDRTVGMGEEVREVVATVGQVEVKGREG